MNEITEDAFDYRERLLEMVKNNQINMDQAKEMFTAFTATESTRILQEKIQSTPATADPINNQLAYQHRKYRNGTVAYTLTYKQLSDTWQFSHERCGCCEIEIALARHGNSRIRQAILDITNNTWLCAPCHDFISRYTIGQVDKLLTYMKRFEG